MIGNPTEGLKLEGFRVTAANVRGRMIGNPTERVLQNSRQGVEAAFERLFCWRLRRASAVWRQAQTGGQRCKNRLRWKRTRVFARAQGAPKRFG